MNKEDTAKQIWDYLLIHDLAHFKSLKKFDGRVYIWYTLKQVSKIIFQDKLLKELYYENDI
ncbi:MAG: hypothetical protein IKP88_11675 [Lachnospiraceae bacterium]|nr:hypothetical protein [Lachnospiraceae bacterium]